MSNLKLKSWMVTNLCPSVNPSRRMPLPNQQFSCLLVVPYISPYVFSYITLVVNVFLFYVCICIKKELHLYSFSTILWLTRQFCHSDTYKTFFKRVFYSQSAWLHIPIMYVKISLYRVSRRCCCQIKTFFILFLHVSKSQ